MNQLFGKLGKKGFYTNNNCVESPFFNAFKSLISLKKIVIERLATLLEGAGLAFCSELVGCTQSYLQTVKFGLYFQWN